MYFYRIPTLALLITFILSSCSLINKNEASIQLLKDKPYISLDTYLHAKEFIYSNNELKARRLNDIALAMSNLRSIMNKYNKSLKNDDLYFKIYRQDYIKKSREIASLVLSINDKHITQQFLSDYKYISGCEFLFSSAEITINEHGCTWTETDDYIQNLRKEVNSR